MSIKLEDVLNELYFNEDTHIQSILDLDIFNTDFKINLTILHDMQTLAYNILSGVYARCPISEDNGFAFNFRLKQFFELYLFKHAEAEYYKRLAEQYKKELTEVM